MRCIICVQADDRWMLIIAYRKDSILNWESGGRIIVWKTSILKKAIVHASATNAEY
jgi:hypothetical protein